MKKDPQIWENFVETYIKNVVSGKKIAGELEILSVKRHLSDLENSAKTGYYFNKNAALKAFAFFSLLRHSKGEFAGRPFELSDWQMFIVWCLFGWMRSDGSRRFRYAYVEVARKNGKTTLPPQSPCICWCWMERTGRRCTWRPPPGAGAHMLDGGAQHGR